MAKHETRKRTTEARAETLRRKAARARKYSGA